MKGKYCMLMMYSALFAMIFVVLGYSTAFSGVGYTEEAWDKKGGTRAEKQRDYKECEYEAVKYGYVPERNTGLRKENDEVFTEIDRLVRKFEIINKCLESRGYQRVENIK